MATSTAVKPVRKRDPGKSKLRASVITEVARLRHETRSPSVWRPFLRLTVFRLTGEDTDMTMRRIMLSLLAAAAVAVLPLRAKAQLLADPGESSGAVATTTPLPPDLTYIRPTGKTKLHNYVFDAFGPYPIVAAGLAAGVNQAYNTPPEWGQGAAGYSKRFASDFGIAAVTTTARYGLAQAFHEDTVYYRCECKGAFPRLRHAVISTLTARRGRDGHSVFSFPALVAPYAGTMTAVYAWYPSRYGAEDALRMGNYTFLVYVGGNIALEFIYGGPHSLLHRMHLPNGPAAPTAGSNP